MTCLSPRFALASIAPLLASLALSLCLSACHSGAPATPTPPLAQAEPVEPPPPAPSVAQAPPIDRRDTPVVESAPPAPQPPRYAEVDWPHVKIDLNNKVVEIEGFSAVNQGWLEQIICLAGTRTHESVLITEAKPSHIHAALLLIGLEPGHPGSWKIDPQDPQGTKWIVEPPKGSPVRITVAWTDKEGQKLEVPVGEWVRDFHTHDLLPQGPWIFGGSLMRADYTGEVGYVADRSGSIAGLVTFGDELLGWNEILPDQEAVMAPEWEANTPAMPEPFTPVTIRLRPASTR